MKFGKLFFALVIFISLAASVHAEGSYKARYLTASDIERVKALKVLLYGVDTKSLQETINELEKTRHPQLSLQMKEAMAKTYVDIVKEINVEGQEKKEWLYSMVCLNMAYLQFGGTQGKYGSTTELNRLIRQKLIGYLPPGVLKQSGFLYSLE